MLLETKRLALREMTPADYPALCGILQDPDVMYAYNGAFDNAEVQAWLDRQLTRYQEYDHRHGLWAVILKETGLLIGQCGLTLQPWKDRQVLEIGYLLRKDHWHQGYATEAAIALREYAFSTLNADEVCSIIRDTNIPSQNVARRNGMAPVDTCIKRYRGVNMPHILFSVKR